MDPIAGQAFLERFADAALSVRQTHDAEVEVVVGRSLGGVTRFANSRIHQNVWTEDLLVNVRVVTPDQRVGVMGVHSDDPRAVAEAAGRALEAARHCPVDEEFPGLAPLAPSESVPVDPATIGATSDERAEVVRAALAEVPADMEAAGAYTTMGGELLVATSAGQRLYTPASQAHLTLVVEGAQSSGYAESGGRSHTDVTAALDARRAVGKARAGSEAITVDPGDWPVVLEPAAVGTLVQFLAYLGFGGRSYLEGRSFVSGRLGERVVDPSVTIVDDALSPDTVGSPFDYEGTPTRRVPLISAGVLAGVVHDRYTAARAGTESTGHGLMAPNPHGPVAVNPLLSAGDGGTTDDLVSGLERGLLVTRFHYTNVVHPLETSITGMTRDGTFLVEDGRIRHAVRNVRFTQSILGALQQVDAIGTETGYATELFFGGGRNPGLRLPRFAFTGATTS